MALETDFEKGFLIRLQLFETVAESMQCENRMYRKEAMHTGNMSEKCGTSTVGQEQTQLVASVKTNG